MLWWETQDMSQVKNDKDWGRLALCVLMNSCGIISRFCWLPVNQWASLKESVSVAAGKVGSSSVGGSSGFHPLPAFICVVVMGFISLVSDWEKHNWIHLSGLWLRKAMLLCTPSTHFPEALLLTGCSQSMTECSRDTDWRPETALLSDGDFGLGTPVGLVRCTTALQFKVIPSWSFPLPSPSFSFPWSYLYCSPLLSWSLLSPPHFVSLAFLLFGDHTFILFWFGFLEITPSWCPNSQQSFLPARLSLYFP